jgi:hypothetical protein
MKNEGKRKRGEEIVGNRSVKNKNKLAAFGKIEAS